MNWIKKVLHIGEKIKKVIKKRATKEEIEENLNQVAESIKT